MANELTRRGLKVVLFEAGKRQSLASFSQNPGEAFAQLTWLEPRSQSGTWDPVKTSPTLPAWHCRTVGGTTVHWTAATPRLQPYEIRARSTLWRHRRGLARRLADRLRRVEALVPGGGEAARGHAPQWQSGYAGIEQFQGDVCRRAAPRLQARAHQLSGDQFARARRSRILHSAGLLRAGLQDRRQMEHAVYRDPPRRGQRQARPAQ